MKSFIKKIANSSLGIELRNTFSFRKVSHSMPNNHNKSLSVSDCFLWRTDNGYKTKFKFADFLSLFYKINNSWVEVYFYSKDNKFIKKIKIENLNLSNEIEITSQFLNNIEDYGLFYIYHHAEEKSKVDCDISVVNRCYLGYSQNNNLYSFVHGNVWAKSKSIYSSNYNSKDIIKTSMIKNCYYTIQKYFEDYDKTELFFANPPSKRIEFDITREKFILKPNCVKLIQRNDAVISIKSNCTFLRPTIFSYKGQFMDAHHS